MANFELTGLTEFREKIERLQREFQPAMRRALAQVVLDAQRVAMKRCPVRTGQTRAGIRSQTGRWTGGSTANLRGVVYPDHSVSEWIGAVERRHGMFRAARAYTRRNLSPSIQAALNALIRDIFGN